MKRVVLLGGGHAHVHVLKSWSSRQLHEATLTLITPYPRQFYSGMLPGLLAGQYAEEACTIPLVPLAKAADATLILSAATRIDPSAKVVELANGKKIAYDVLSIDTGAGPAMSSIIGAEQHAVAIRPLERFVPRLRERLAALYREPKARVAVIGAGAGGVELALAIRHTLGSHPSPTVMLVTSEASVLPSLPGGVQRTIMRALRERGVAVVPAARTASIEPGWIVLTQGQRLAADLVVLANGAAPLPWLQSSGLACDEAGYIATGKTMQSLSHPQVFAVGDCASRPDAPRPRSGVYAVRAGPPLAENLARFIQGKPLRRYRPQRWSLVLLNCADESAVGCWGPFFATGDWLWRWKDKIDRAFVARYSPTQELS
jgi:pyridine nucleotide-disulfide oxidoreductase family protein